MAALDVNTLRRFAKDLSNCPHPDKLRFRSEARALERASALGLETYKCVCGQWHMTGQCTMEPCCPICGAPDDEWSSCGCYEELMYGD